MNQYLNRHINEFQSVQNQRPILIVFQGFEKSFLTPLKSNKLFDVSLNVNLEALASRKAELIPQLFQAPSDRCWHWCSREEMITVGAELLPLYFTVFVLRNNIFDRTYPSLYPFEADTHLVQAVGTDETEIDDNGNERVTLLSRFYGSIRIIGKKQYVTYSESIEESIPFYPTTVSLPSEAVREADNIHLELSDTEDDFLLLQDRLLDGVINDAKIMIALSGELDRAPHRYHERLHAMQGVLQGHYQFIIAEKETVQKPARDNSAYSSILKQYWGHSSFRNLRMYRNIHSRSRDKSTVDISQSQIIDDLVQEALKAKQGEDHKDIFVTSPTGAGKSVMFQIPAIYLAEQHQLMTIVISPLIGLMTDQVQGLISRNVEISATINSDITPVERMEIKDRIQEGKVSILYISPETLLSRSDIAQLIGERKIGLFVIDEAHIVTTWGKAFRSDYWYLGTYLTKLRQTMNFPIATFTATAIYGGLEDMYEETRNSLNMITPICYFGYVRRDNLEIRIKKKIDQEKKFTEYLNEKNTILMRRLEKFASQGKKTLVYFPTVKAILDFKQFVRLYGNEHIRDHLAIYYGPLEKEQKQENYLRYKRNEAIIMLATKAFGMGIDIPDIENVYHYAPTGNVCDYVQEIGRAARDLPTGFAYFDFLPKDFVHVQRLHGISTIKKNQLIEVIRKILSILDQQRGSNIRNLLVSADEFRYIFQDGGSRDQQDDIDNKIKTALLIIEKDFLAKLTYAPLVARPRSLFAKEYMLVTPEVMAIVFPTWSKYFKVVSELGSGSSARSILACDLKSIWQDKFTSLSFPEFKYHFYSSENKVKLPFKGKVTPVMQIMITLKQPNEAAFSTETRVWIDRIGSIMGRYAKSREYFNTSDIASDLLKMSGATSKYQAEMLADILLNSMYAFDRFMRKANNFYNRFLKFDESRNAYHFLNTGYAGFLEWIARETANLFKEHPGRQLSSNEFEVYDPKVFGQNQEKRFLYLGLMEAMGLLLYQINGGECPEIYIRVNSRAQLERTINQPAAYRNTILSNVHMRHEMSVEMLRYLFEKEADTSMFWGLIEDYFLGQVPEEVTQRLAVKQRG